MADRRLQQLMRTDAAEAWLIGWDPGHELGLHDHGDSVGSITVVSGTLTEYWVPTGASKLQRRELGPGDTLTFDVGHVHHVANEQLEPALSVHVYSPRLRSMTFYDHRPESFLAPLREEVLV